MQVISRQLLQRLCGDDIEIIMGLQAQGASVMGSFFQQVLSSLHTDDAKALRKRVQSSSILNQVAGSLLQCMDRMETLAKCILHLLAVEPEAEGVTTDAKHVFFFSSYAGKSHFEKTIRRLISAEGSYWHEQVTEVTKVSAKCILAQGAQQEMKQLLAQQPTLPVIASALKTFQTLRESVRSAHLRMYTESLVKIILDNTASLMDGSCQLPTHTLTVDVLLEGLTLFEALPGVPSHKMRLKEWMTKQAALIAMGDVCRMLEYCGQETMPVQELDFKEITKVLEIARKHGGIYLPDNKKDAAFAGFRKMLLSVTHKARFLLTALLTGLVCDSHQPSLFFSTHWFAFWICPNVIPAS